MSYIRFGYPAEAYIYHNVNGWIECCMCRLTPLNSNFNYESVPIFYESVQFKSRLEAEQHITLHIAAAEELNDDLREAQRRIKLERHDMGDNIKPYNTRQASAKSRKQPSRRSSRKPTASKGRG